MVFSFDIVVAGYTLRRVTPESQSHRLALHVRINPNYSASIRFPTPVHSQVFHTSPRTSRSPTATFAFFSMSSVTKRHRVSRVALDSEAGRTISRS